MDSPTLDAINDTDSNSTKTILTRPEQFQGVPPLAEILARRGVQSEQELELKLKHIMPPHLKGLDAAVELIDQAIDRQQQIVIIGDYDADGDQYSTYDLSA